MSNIMLDAFLSMLPEGSAWEFSDSDDFLNALSENYENVRQYLSNLSTIRDPMKTTLLSDLEREFGILSDSRLSENDRRMILSSRKFNNGVNGTADLLQQKLDAAGFDVLVHKNDPPVDPAQFIDESYQMVAGGFNAYAGRSDAYAGKLGGEYLLNGNLVNQAPDYLSSAGNMYAGNTVAVAGQYDDFIETPYTNTTPTDSTTWGFIFFVGGTATRNVDGELTNIELATVPSKKKNELKKIILRYKPIFTWCGLVIA